MGSFHEEKEKEKKLIMGVNIFITILLGIAIAVTWFDPRQEIADKVSMSVLYGIALIFYLLAP